MKRLLLTAVFFLTFTAAFAQTTPTGTNTSPGCTITAGVITCGTQSLTPGTGSVTSVSVTTANGVSGSVATATTTPAISLTLGAITPSALTVSGASTFPRVSASLFNEVIGAGAGNATMTGDSNVIMGNLAGAALTSSREDVIIGFSAGQFTTTGSGAFPDLGQLTLIGSYAGQTNTIGVGNTCVGQKACTANSTGSNISAFGVHAGAGVLTNNWIAIGNFAAASASTSGAEIIAIGTQAAQYQQGSGGNSIWIGTNSGSGTVGDPNTGSLSVAVGQDTGKVLTSGGQHVLMGYQAGLALTTASSDVLLGYQAGKALTTGGPNVIAIGAGAGSLLTTAARVICLGGNSCDSLPVSSQNFFVAGASGNEKITDVFFGTGYANASPSAYTVHGSGGLGSNIAGGSVTYAGGQGTGTGNGGNAQFAVALPSGSSSTLNSLTNIANFAGATGHFLWNTDNTYDIGATGATRPRAGYFGTSVTIGAGSAITSSGAGGALGTNAFTSTTYAPLNSPTFTGTVTLPDASTATSTGLSGVVKLSLVGPQTNTIVGTTTTTASNALNNTSTGNITVGSTTGWPATGTLKTGGGNNTEFMSFSVVDATTLNITARGSYSSTNAVHAGTVTLSYAFSIDAASTSALPINSKWSDGTQQVNTGSTGDTSLFLGLNHNTGFYFSGGAPAFAVNGSQVFSVSASALTLPSGSSIALSGLNITSPNSAIMQLGLADGAVPIAQTLKVQSVVAGTAAANGTNWTLIGSLPTGTGTSGDIIFQTGVKTGSGTTQGTATTAMTIKGETQAIVTSALDSSTSAGGALQVAGGASVAKRLWIPAITASSGLQTAVLCQSSGGEMIADSVACLASSARFKNIRGSLSSDVVDKFMKLPIKIWAYKPEGIFKKGNWTRDRIGPVAEDVERLDPRLVEYDSEGQVRAYSTEQLLAYTIKVVQEQQVQIDYLRAKLH